MNERIKQLAEQADYYAYEQYDVKKVPYSVLFNQKFAELIVQECATAIINDDRLNDVRSAANGCVRTIREHFGVEE